MAYGAQNDRLERSIVAHSLASPKARSTKNTVWIAANIAIPASPRWRDPANPSPIAGSTTALLSSQTSSALHSPAVSGHRRTHGFTNP